MPIEVMTNFGLEAVGPSRKDHELLIGKGLAVTEKTDQETTVSGPQAAFNFAPNKSNAEKQTLTISIPLVDKTRPKEERRHQKILLNYLYKNAFGFKTFRYNQEASTAEFFYKNSTAILTVLDAIKEDYNDLYVAANLQVPYEQIKQQQKKSLANRKRADLSYTLRGDEDLQKVGGSHVQKVFRFTLSEEERIQLKLPTRDVYYKYEPNLIDSRSYEYQAIAAASYELYLGVTRAPETRVVYDAQGIRVGTISAAFDDWQPISDFIEDYVENNKYPSQPSLPTRALDNAARDFSMEHFYPKEMVHQLVQDGIVEVMAVSSFMQNPDAHFDNVGYHGGFVSYMDFDLALASLMNWQVDEDTGDRCAKYRDGCALDKGWDIVSSDIGNNFATPKTLKPFHWFDKYGFSIKNEFNSDYNFTPELAEQVKSAQDYLHQQFLANLRMILTPLEDNMAYITRILKDEKHERIVGRFFKSRRKEEEKACLGSSQFCNWLLDYHEDLKEYMKGYFEDYYTQSTFSSAITSEAIAARLATIDARFERLVDAVVNKQEEVSADSCDHSTEEDFADAQSSENLSFDSELSDTDTDSGFVSPLTSLSGSFSEEAVFPKVIPDFSLEQSSPSIIQGLKQTLFGDTAGNNLPPAHDNVTGLANNQDSKAPQLRK